MKTLNISIPIIFEPELMEADLIEKIKDEILENENSFRERSEMICKEYDMRADYCEDSLVIEDIVLRDIKYSDDDVISEIFGIATVTYEWYAHYGCKDMCGGDQVGEDWSFHIIDNNIIFNLPFPEQRYDEL